MAYIEQQIIRAKYKRRKESIPTVVVVLLLLLLSVANPYTGCKEDAYMNHMITDKMRRNSNIVDKYYF